MQADRKLNVLTLCSWYPNRTNPTLGNFVQKHAEAAGIYNNVTVISQFSDPNISSVEVTKSIQNGITEIIAYYPKSLSSIGFIRKVSSFLNHRKAFRKSYQLALETMGQPDIVHLNIIYPMGTWALWLKMRHKIPFVITENSSGLHVGSDHAYPPAAMKLCEKALNKASVLMPVSLNLKSHMQKLAPQATFEIISNVVDEEKFEVSTKSKGSVVKLIHISTGVDSIKNLTGMIHTLNRLKSKRSDFHLDIVSDGDTEYAKQLVNELGCQSVVTFHSTKTTIEVAQMLSESDALLMFSNYENFPCVIAESFMTGLPVISSNVNGIPEHVNTSNGLLVQPRNEEELERAIEQFLDGSITFDRSSIRSYAEEHFGYRAVGKSFDTIYRKVLKQS
ncbi:MAG: hypothetical protein RI922_1401 [Bacteroidota bacterium]|jgi:glycosyltransferase involved in cell wall biosynthesis